MDTVEVALLVWKDKHKSSIGHNYIVSYGKDQKILKEILAVYDLKITAAMMTAFFKLIDRDEFLKKTGASIGIFRTQIPKLLLSMEQPNKAGVLDAESLGRSA